MLETLGEEIGRGNATDISDLVKAFLAVGGNAKELAQDVVNDLDPEIGVTVRWLLNDIGPREVAAKLRPACGEVAASEQVLQDLDTKWRMAPDASGVVWTLLGGWNRIAVPFYKTVQSPVDHAETVRKLTAISGGVSLLAMSYKRPNPAATFAVLLVHQGLGIRFPVENHGRWCNVQAVLDGLNGILDSLGLSERFIELNSGTSDVALVTFARADIFLPLAHELGVRLAGLAKS